MTDSYENDEFGMGFGDESIATRADNYKGKEGETDRLGFPWLYTYTEMKARFEAAGKTAPEMPEGASGDDPAFEWEGSVRFISGERAYKDGVGFVRIPKDPEERTEFLRVLGADAKKSVGTFVVKYRTEDDGSLPKDEEDNLLPLSFKVMPWTFSPDKYQALKRSNKNFPLRNHDIEATCNGTQYQKMAFSPCHEGLWARKDDRRSKILTQVKAQLAAGALNLGRTLSLDQLREALGMAVTPSASAAGGDENYDDLINDL